ncbi:MAG: HEPN domain-containing protein [Lentimicrobiaceae bacterium]|nr:HEPN domain-containing protein [Lentimicrobiaceae bacterium]
MNIDKEKIKSILEKCLIDGLDLIKKQKEEDKKRDWHFTFEHHDDYPTMSEMDNGMPSFYLNSYKKIDYSKFLTKDKKYLEIESWQKFHEFVLAEESLCKYYSLIEYGNFKEETKDEIKEFHSQIYTYFFVSDFIDSYIHKYSLEFETSSFEHIFQLFYNSFNNEKIEINIIVPILFVDFDFESIQINDSISIERIDKQIQLARNTRKSYTSSAHETVIGAATHAFVLKGWFVDNISQHQLDWNMPDLKYFGKPIAIIERLFASLRLVSDIETGYCQVISEPINWQYRCKADLPQIFVASEKRYPDKFENYGWLNLISKVSKDELVKFKTVFEQLDSKQHTLAIKRLNSASLRKNDEDSILDVTIALESLLTNDSTSEITYRLATRATQICKLSSFKDYSTSQVFDFCKKIYKYRSAVVHGDLKRIEKTKKIESTDSKEIEIIKISTDLLKHILVTMLENGIKDTNSIDKIMM